MSSRDGRGMDRPPPGSVRRARERAAMEIAAEGGSPPRRMVGAVDNEPQIARPSMPRPVGVGLPAGPKTLRGQAPQGLQVRGGQAGVAISRPTPVPQWPLGEALAAPPALGGEPYRPPPGRSQPPQRPPRPSRVPSILDASKIQDHTPVFQYRPRSGRESGGQELAPVAEIPSSSTSRQSTLSSTTTIPDFPLPVQMAAGPPRRSVNLGPPPSARRGASSFYSNASFVSPIPEESPGSRRSYTSFASSAAMPESWGEPSPGPSPTYADGYYDDTIAEESNPSAYGDEDAEESRLVRSVSVGKMAKPTLVSATGARGMERLDRGPRPNPTPIQTGPFQDGTGYVDKSSSSSTIPASSRLPIGMAVTAEAMPSAFSTTSATESSSAPDATPPTGGRLYNRLSAIRRPPKLDIDAVHKAESRGSLTSLPDLIRRATRLAASLERGRRPASQFDSLNDSPPDDYADNEKHQSGLSDMLAAFPPPAQPAAAIGRRSIRESIREQVQSWPLPFNSNRSPNTSQEANPSDTERPEEKPTRRCCGLPLWAFILVLVMILILVTAAVVIPVEFFVIRRQNAERDGQAQLQQCQTQLPCANGGVNVLSQGTCSCICTNGFTGYNCTVPGTVGCTTVSVNNVNGVTIGNAIPRLVDQAQANFSIPLDLSEVVAKLNGGNLSCSASNALVTFDGQSSRQGSSQAQAIEDAGAVDAAAGLQGIIFTTITVVAGQATTVTLSPGVVFPTPPAASQDGGEGEAGQSTSFSTTVAASSGFATTVSLSRSTRPSTTSTVTMTMSMSSGVAVPTATFAVTDEVLDFSRVAVLFFLQEGSLAEAQDSQVTLQRLFASATPGSNSFNGGVSIDTARNVTVAAGRSVDLVNFVVDLGGGEGRFGRRVSSVQPRSWRVEHPAVWKPRHLSAGCAKRDPWAAPKE